MKKTLPIVIGLVAGLFAFAEYFIPAKGVHLVHADLLNFAQILASAAFVLGGLNILQVAMPIIQHKRSDWIYKIIMVLSAVAMLLVGVAWHDFGSKAAVGTISKSPVPAARDAAPRDATVTILTTQPDAQVSLDGVRLVGTHGATTQSVTPGEKHSVTVSVMRSGYTEYDGSFEAAAGQTVTFTVRNHMLWGTSGRTYLWLYDHVFAPCNATMFALLAFFIASAAFRAFRARNTEAALLLGAAILVMIGRVPIGAAMSDVFPAIADWILQYPNNAGRRAIMMGAALGAVATSLRVILGLERTHLGGD